MGSGPLLLLLLLGGLILGLVALNSATSQIAGLRGGFLGGQDIGEGSLGVVQMGVDHLEEVVGDLVEVLNRAEVEGGHVLLVMVDLELANHADVEAFSPARPLLRGVFRLVLSDPLPHLEHPSAIFDLEN